MNILLIGSGGREHALAWKIVQSKHCSHLFIAPGNAGTSLHGTNVDIGVNDFEKLKTFALDHQIDMLVVGPEDPLVNGIHDFFAEDTELKHISVIGPKKKGALLEGSKDFSKDFMIRYNIPTAAYQTFDKDSIQEGVEFLKTLKPPYVLKADGLAAGKGVIISESFDEASEELRLMLTEDKFGAASAKVVIEEFLLGVEMSVFVITDGKDYKLFPVAKDYKRIGEGDTGLNTGGMGSISHVPFMDEELMQKVEDKVIKPTIDGLINDGIEYKGFIFFGLINVDGEPYVIEYNARMGDPETESVVPRIKSDIMELFMGVAEGNLANRNIEIDPRQTAAIMLVSGGYPEAYEKNKTITGIEKVSNSLVFHAGTKQDANADEVLTNGGRVIAITSYGDTMQEALDKSYANAKIIEFEGKYYRTDLGKDLEKFIK